MYGRHPVPGDASSGLPRTVMCHGNLGRRTKPVEQGPEAFPKGSPQIAGRATGRMAAAELE